MMHVTKAGMEKVRIPVPPLAEQKRIAMILKDRFATVERAREAARVQLDAAAVLPAAFLREIRAIGRDAGWPNMLLGDLLTTFEAGKCVSCEERPATMAEWGVLKVSSVSWGAFRPHENKVLPSSFPVSAEREVRVGDFLFSRSNTTELVGAVVHVKQTRPRLLLSDKTLRLVLRPTLVLPEFLELALRSPETRAFIEENATGASSPMKKLAGHDTLDPADGAADQRTAQNHGEGFSAAQSC